MKCHAHTDRDAIAICKHCARGLCADCAIPQRGGTACGDACAAAIETTFQQLVDARRRIKLRRSAPKTLGGVFVIIGIACVGLASAQSSLSGSFFQVAGTILLISGLLFLMLWRLQQREK